MSKSRQLFYVLWASGFEEEMAAIFITELRRANQRVKLVGLTSRAARGAYGTALVPDLSLDEAFLSGAKVVWMVIPCSLHSCRYLQTDPRLPQFIQMTQPDSLITGVLNQTDRALFPQEFHWIEVDPTDVQLIETIRTLVAMNI